MFQRVVLAASLLSLSACAPCLRGVEHVTRQTNYGHEFCRATIDLPAQSGVESIDPTPHCYYQRRDLGACRIMSVSPSGRMALWQDRATGSLRLFNFDWREPRVLAEKFAGQVQHVDWNEADPRSTCGCPARAWWARSIRTRFRIAERLANGSSARAYLLHFAPFLGSP